MTGTPPREDPPFEDPTFVRNQPALTRSTSRIWLIAGAILSAVALVILGLLLELDPRAATIGIVVVIALYLAMIAIRVTVRDSRLRLGLLAAGMLSIAGAALTVITLIGWTQADSLVR
jgi:hypothetical protein